MHDVIISGAGAAGLTAAIYIKRAGFSPLVLEKGIYGGQLALTSGVENYPGIKSITGWELAAGIYSQAEALGVEVKYEAVTGAELNPGRKNIITPSGSYASENFIIASGVRRRELGCEGEARLLGKGVSYCATCDGAFFKARVTAVVGGGNTALEDALYLSKICQRVYLIHRRDTYRAEGILVERVKNTPNIEAIMNSGVVEIMGSENVSSIKIKNYIDGKGYELPVSGIFIAIGMLADNGIFSEYINLDESGYILAGESCETNVPGVFAAGDCRAKPLRQIVTAAADGAVAGHNAAARLNLAGK